MKKVEPSFSRKISEFVKKGFSPQFGKLKKKFTQNPIWQRLREIGSELWLDTGSIDEAGQYWTQEFSALTTNNTLLNREVQKGQYDSLVAEANAILTRYPGLSEQQRMLEIAFILNAKHGLRLVEKFDAYVSVEEHTALANDVNLAVECAHRYYAICPQRFIVKIPFTPAGLLATRRLSKEGVPVNHTLGFSARQNYVIARIGQPQYVNVFLGRLNSFIVDNKLGSGAYVGEKATLASQAAVKKLRQAGKTVSRQIGASFREGAQIRDLAGIDVMTMPPKVAGEFLALNMAPGQLTDKTGIPIYRDKIGLADNADPASIRLETLWDIDDKLVACLDALEKKNLDSFTPDDLITFFESHNCGDVLVRWSDSQIATSTKEGKIPRLENWRDALADKSIGLDSLMNLAGLCSFVTDQKAMDERVAGVLTRTVK